MVPLTTSHASYRVCPLLSLSVWSANPNPFRTVALREHVHSLLSVVGSRGLSPVVVSQMHHNWRRVVNTINKRCIFWLATRTDSLLCLLHLKRINPCGTSQDTVSTFYAIARGSFAKDLISCHAPLPAEEKISLVNHDDDYAYRVIISVLLH